MVSTSLNRLGAASLGLECRIVTPRQGRWNPPSLGRRQPAWRGAPRSHRLKPSRWTPTPPPPIPAPQPLASSVVHPSRGPTALGSVALDSGRLCSGTPEAQDPGSSRWCPPATRTRRAATCSANSARVCADAAVAGGTQPSARPGRFRISKGACQPPAPGRTALRTGSQAPATPSPGLAPTLAPAAGPPGTLRPKYLRRRCRERRASCRPWYPGAECRVRRWPRESLSGLIERTRRRRLLLCPAGWRWEPGGPGGTGGGRAGKPGERGAAAALGQLRVLRRPASFCSIPAAGAWGRLRRRASRAKPLPPGPAATTRPPPAFPLPALRPGSPAQGGLCWTVRAPDPRLEGSAQLGTKAEMHRSVSRSLPWGTYLRFLLFCFYKRLQSLNR